MKSFMYKGKEHYRFIDLLKEVNKIRTVSLYALKTLLNGDCVLIASKDALAVQGRGHSITIVRKDIANMIISDYKDIRDNIVTPFLDHNNLLVYTYEGREYYQFSVFYKALKNYPTGAINLYRKRLEKYEKISLASQAFYSIGWMKPKNCYKTPHRVLFITVKKGRELMKKYNVKKIDPKPETHQKKMEDTVDKTTDLLDTKTPETKSITLSNDDAKSIFKSFPALRESLLKSFSDEDLGIEKPLPDSVNDLVKLKGFYLEDGKPKCRLFDKYPENGIIFPVHDIWIGMRFYSELLYLHKAFYADNKDYDINFIIKFGGDAPFDVYPTKFCDPNLIEFSFETEKEAVKFQTKYYDLLMKLNNAMT